MKHVVIALLGAFCVSTLTAAADSATKLKPYKDSLSSVPAAEMPAKASETVKQAKAQELAATTVSVVKAAIEVNPMALPAVVGAIARSVPDMAPVAASAAAEAQPKQAAVFAKSAAVAAPSQAGLIVVAVCRSVPASYKSVAVTVAKAVPGSTKEVLAAVGSALPQLRGAIEKALAGNAESNVSVAALLDQAAATSGFTPAMVNSSSGLRGGATFGPPIDNGAISGSQTAANGQGQTGKRNYANP